MPDGNIMKVYQVYDEADPAGTDQFHRTKKDANHARTKMLSPSPVLEHDILTSKAGLIEALRDIPMRNVGTSDREALEALEALDALDAYDGDGGDDTPEPEIEF